MGRPPGRRPHLEGMEGGVPPSPHPAPMPTTGIGWWRTSWRGECRPPGPTRNHQLLRRSARQPRPCGSQQHHGSPTAHLGEPGAHRNKYRTLDCQQETLGHLGKTPGNQAIHSWTTAHIHPTFWTAPSVHQTLSGELLLDARPSCQPDAHECHMRPQGAWSPRLGDGFQHVGGERQRQGLGHTLHLTVWDGKFSGY